ncbi:38875_t:CDS:2, partial [Gigaspora margarita]
QPSAILDSSKGIDLDLYRDQYSSYYFSESNILYEDIYSESQYEEYSHGELYETFILSELSDSKRGFAVRKECIRTHKDSSVWNTTWSLRMLVQATNLSLPIMITDTNLAMNAAIHIGQNVLKNLRNKLLEKYKDFSKAFFRYYNRLEIIDFEQQFSELIEKYPIVQTYLNHLYKSKKSW